MESNQVIFPLYFKCSSKAQFDSLNKKASDLLGYPNEDAEIYSTPTIDVNGKYWIIINPEISELVDLTLCVDYDSIVLPENKI